MIDSTNVGEFIVQQWFTILIGVMGGIAVGIQSPIAGAMGQRVGGAAGSLIVHVSGAVLSALLLVARGGENIREWRVLPWYMLASGAFGLILYLTINHTLPRAGAAVSITLIIVGQLVVGLVVDHFGWLGVPTRPVDAARVVAVLLLLAGGYLMAR
ncbi:MAG: DMT family transporter [Chloroflexi bacterium]|nr:DMT family transporter [Chloroflexota bacterium]